MLGHCSFKVGKNSLTASLLKVDFSGIDVAQSFLMLNDEFVFISTKNQLYADIFSSLLKRSFMLLASKYQYARLRKYVDVTP